MGNKYLEELLKSKNIDVHEDDSENIRRWNDLVDSSKLDDWSKEDIELESKYLKTELIKHRPVNIYELVSLVPVEDHPDKILFYNGDISAMFIDAIAIPVAENKEIGEDKRHSVYYYNGINLRKKLAISIQDKGLKNGEVLITRSYNMPTDFIIHVNYDYADLSTSIINILECSRVNMIKSVLIDIDMNDIALLKETYQMVDDYLDKYDALFDKILIYVSDSVNIKELEKEL